MTRYVRSRSQREAGCAAHLREGGIAKAVENTTIARAMTSPYLKYSTSGLRTPTVARF